MGLSDADIIDNAAISENFRCVISGPSECGKTILLKELIISNIYFDKLYIIGPTGDQYEGVESYKDKASVEFIKDVKDLPLSRSTTKRLKETYDI